MDAMATGRVAACRPDGAGPVGIYKPRRPQASPLLRLVADQFRTLQLVYDERFAPTYGAWRAVVPEVADKFLACGVLEHGFARVRCDACAHEYLLAFSCKARYFCPSCHAKRLALWTLWLEETLLAAVPHRQVVLTIPKRLRTSCLYRRALLGDLARVAARTVTAAVRMLTREPDLAVGVVACIQTHGSLANWHPHIHLLVTDGGFRADGMSSPGPRTIRRASPKRFAAPCSGSSCGAGSGGYRNPELPFRKKRRSANQRESHCGINRTPRIRRRDISRSLPPVPSASRNPGKSP